jgi:phosphatidylethanolamine/phosphatidyl-N-methylethanolamine N-methyltransferase
MDRAWVELIEAAARRPLGVATLFPTSGALARRMMRVVEGAPVGPVVELGAGAGAITRLLSPAARGPVTAIEVDPALARFVAARFPGITVQSAGAEDLLRIVERDSLAAVVSSLPWSVIPALSRERILGSVRAALRPDGLFVTYLCLNALAHPGGRSFVARVRAHFGQVQASTLEWRNLPPARMIVARP